MLPGQQKKTKTDGGTKRILIQKKNIGKRCLIKCFTHFFPREKAILILHFTVSLIFFLVGYAINTF